METLLCPSTSCICRSGTPALAIAEAAECLRSWKRESSSPAFLANLLKRCKTSTGPSLFSAGNTQSTDPMNLLLNRQQSNFFAGSLRGTFRISRFLVSLKITVLFFKSTSLHFKPQISSCRTPVNKASNTTSWRFWSFLQTSSNRCCSSSVRYRVR